MIRDITLGQFFPGDSVIHRMDSRMKLVLTFGLIIFVFIATSAVSAALLIAAVLALMVLTQVPMKVYLRGLKPILIIVLFTGRSQYFLRQNRDGAGAVEIHSHHHRRPAALRAHCDSDRRDGAAQLRADVHHLADRPDRRADT